MNDTLFDITGIRRGTAPVTPPAPSAGIDGAVFPDGEALIREKLARLAGSGQSVIRLHDEMPFELREKIRENFGTAPKPDPEAYAIEISEQATELYSISHRGLFYAIQTLFRLWEQPEQTELLLYDAPILPERGVKLFLPPPTDAGLHDFRNLIGMLARYRYNLVMIELGGAMEYRRHPEINDAWRTYAAYMNEYPGKALRIQKESSFEHNSIHAVNGGGDVVSRERIAELREICRRNFIEIIPEVPALSHADYLLEAHPELAEDATAEWPDACCPSNPATRQLLFELLEEVVEVWEPKRVNICHDEYYTIGICDRCRGKRPEELLAGDVNRTADFLASLGVKTMVASDKFLPAHLVNGKPAGGSQCAPSGKNTVPATCGAFDLLNCRDVELLHWYWSVGRELDQEICRRKFKMLFWNFTGSTFPDWKRRSVQSGVSGIIISNWGALDLRTLQRNGIFWEIVYASALCWNPAAADDDRACVDFAAEELFRFRRGLTPPGSRLTVEHRTDFRRDFLYYYDGNYLDESADLLGHHRFIGERTGKAYEFPVIFGTNISHPAVRPYREPDTNPERELDQDRIDPQFQETTFETLLCRDAEGGLWFRCDYPYPGGEQLRYDRFEPAPHHAGTTVELRRFEQKETRAI